MYADLLVSGHFGSLNNKQLEAIKSIKGTAKRANTMHSLCMDEIQLIDFVYGPNKATFEIIEIQAWFREIIERYGYIAKTKKQQFVINIPESQYVKSDKHQGAKMIGYLIDNACKYSGEDELITITSEAKPNHILVKITDNGIGISAEEQQHIFEGWYRSGHDYVSKQEGFGRGLYNAKRLAKVLGCKIGVESEVGKGSTFWFTLPLAETTTDDEING
jgi:signal transduction histidine kinase